MELWILSITISILTIALFIFYKKISDLKKPASDTTLLEWLKTMQKSIDQTNKTINDSLSSNSTHMIRTLQENSRQLNDRLDKAAQVISGVSREVGQMSEIGRGMRELQDFLKSPKLRGNIGEHILNDLLAQIFPKNSFHLQYQFKSGEKVDAAITTDAGILPIDSKFPMENFTRLAKSKTEQEANAYQHAFIKDIEKHIDTIAKKYILPDEGTMDFALMYVPSETVFYEIVNIEELSDYARSQRVYVVSPTTLYAHLQTILLSFEGKKIETESREILKTLHALQLDYSKTNDQINLLGKHINNSANQFGNVQKSFSGLGHKLQSVKHLNPPDKESLTKK